MFRLEVTHPAVGDIEDILHWSLSHHGAEGRRRYEALIASALRDLAADPYRPATRRRHDISSGMLTFHLRHARKRKATGANRVKVPRHLVVFRVLQPDLVQVLRVLHESMDIEARLGALSKRG